MPVLQKSRHLEDYQLLACKTRILERCMQTSVHHSCTSCVLFRAVPKDLAVFAVHEICPRRRRSEPSCWRLTQIPHAQLLPRRRGPQGLNKLPSMHPELWSAKCLLTWLIFSVESKIPRFCHAVFRIHHSAIED